MLFRSRIQKKNLIRNQEYLLNHSSKFFAILDEGLRVTWANKDFLNINGLNEETVLQKHASDFFEDYKELFSDQDGEHELEIEKNLVSGDEKNTHSFGRLVIIKNPAAIF